MELPQAQPTGVVPVVALQRGVSPKLLQRVFAVQQALLDKEWATQTSRCTRCLCLVASTKLPHPEPRLSAAQSRPGRVVGLWAYGRSMMNYRCLQTDHLGQALRSGTATVGEDVAPRSGAAPHLMSRNER